MKTYSYNQIGMVLLLISFAMLAIAISYRYDKDTKQLKEEIEYKQFQIDSLCNEIDTLQWETEIWDYNVNYNTTHLLSALIMVESRNNDSAHAVGEDAVGCLQIRKTMVDDVNRILKRQNKEHRFSYSDRWDRQKSIKMFDIYCKHYGLTTAEEIARCWNGGPRGMNKEATVYYWKKVQDHLDS
mgnify:FL=1|tara:strand:+ start:1077 stop:1628 length:552 start_codon:yes stop_codon:yes gene_type:complete